MDLDLLKSELLAGHPVTGAYNADNELAANEINAINRSRNIPFLTGDQVFSSTSASEFDTLTDSKKQLWVSFCSRNEINPFGTSNVNFVNHIFGNGSVTINNLQALRTEDVSRGVELGLGNVSVGNIEEARRL